MRRLIQISLLGLLLPFQILAQRPSPTSVSLSQLTDSLRQLMAQQRIPGMMLVLVSRDSVLYAGGLGYADLEQKTPVSNQHLFRMGSVTKIVTALGILQLVQEGRLSLNDPVRALAPELPIVNPWERTHPVRVIHLLEHTSGFSDKLISQAYNPAPRDLPMLEALQVFKGSFECRWKPGERHSYANPNYNLAAYLIEKRSGKPWDAYIRETIFGPIGMPQANLDLRAHPARPYARGYFWQEDAYHQTPFLPLYQGGNGSLNASAADLAPFLQCFLRNWKTASGDQLLPPRLLEEAETVHSTLAARSGLTKTGYGLGLEAYDGPDGFQFRGHRGSIGAFVSSVGYNRTLGVGYAFAFNSAGDVMPAENLIRSFLTQGNVPPQPVVRPLEAGAVAPYLGYYRFASSNNRVLGVLEELRFRFTLRVENGKLIQHSLMGPSFPLEAAGPMHFRLPWHHYPIVALVTDSDGKRAVEQAGLYFQKISVFEAWAPIILLLGSLLLVSTSVLAGLIWLGMALFGRLRRRDTLLRLLPMVGTIALGMSLHLGLTRFGQHVTQGTDMMPDFYLIFICTLLFAACTAATILLLLLRWKQLTNGWLRSYLLVVALASVCLTTFFWMNGWVGLRMWAL